MNLAQHNRLAVACTVLTLPYFQYIDATTVGAHSARVLTSANHNVIGVAIMTTLWQRPRMGSDGPRHHAASVSAAVLFALHGVTHIAHAQEQMGTDQQGGGAQAGTLQEVVVTASRRAETVEQVPYSISVISGPQLDRAGVTDIVSLTNQVPGLSMYDFGTKDAGATTPIIRGINATAAPTDYQGFRSLEQSPVSVYIDNSPVGGYFQLVDVQRVEVLRGPQGTLYGAGALGGAVRIIPNAPALNSLSGDVEIGGGTLAHSSGVPYTLSAVLNAPIGNTLAFRASGKYVYEPGFVDVYGILERPGSSGSGMPALADPTEPVTSPGIFTGKQDWNYQKTLTGRGSLLWKPAENFTAEAALTYADAFGDASPLVNPDFLGGQYPIDPRITFPSGGDYRTFSPIDQPWSRRSTLDSLDMSYDAGFATLSSTSSYFSTQGSTVVDNTYIDAGFAVGLNPLLPAVMAYYAGTPFNPRFVSPSVLGDSTDTFSQEVRLVSATGPNKPFDYVVGVFYQHQKSDGFWNLSNPGSPEYSAAEGCTAPYVYPGGLPNCLLVSGPGDVFLRQVDSQSYEEKSEYAELTWHFAKRAQITVGGRHFEESFTDLQSYSDWPFDIFLPAEPRSAPASKNIGKVDISYEYAANHRLYALWSQGFRRGGANAVPLVGTFREPAALLSYVPDTVNNYEIGIKGHFVDGPRYTFDVFDIQWDNPQVAGTTPAGNLAVWNGKKAESKGFEGDLTTPLLLTGLTLSAGGSYTEAKFTEDFTAGTDEFGTIGGKAGQQLPGSPKLSAVATLNYQRSLMPGYEMAVSLNDTYRSSEYLSTTTVFNPLPGQISAINIVNLSATVSHESWRLGVYVTNLTDKYVFLSEPTFYGLLANLTNARLVNPPREVDIRVGYTFGN